MVLVELEVVVDVVDEDAQAMRRVVVVAKGVFALGLAPAHPHLLMFLVLVEDSIWIVH